MFKDYQIISPSLEGVLNHESITYEGIRRPIELLRVLDGPATKGHKRGTKSNHNTDKDNKILEEYFNDLHDVFMKKFASFVLESEVSPGDTIKLQAMLQEMIKVKTLKGR